MKPHQKLFTFAVAGLMVALAPKTSADILEVGPISGAKAGKIETTAANNVLRAGDFIGMNVERGSRQKVGKIEDVVVGLEKGRIVAVLIALGETGTLRAVPPHVLHFDPLQKVIHLKPTLEKLREAPVIERPTWKEAMKAEKLAVLYRHFDEEPFFAVPEKGSKETASPLGAMEMATKLSGGPVFNPKGDRLGLVQDCMVDLSTGHIPFVIISTGAYTGVDGALNPVPTEALSYDNKREGLILDAGKDALALLPHFKAGEWPDMNSGTYLDSVYLAYGIKNKATIPAADTDKTAKVVPETPEMVKQDAEITSSIRKEILARKDISADAKSAKVATKDGKVTLKGQVKTAEEKRVLNELAVQHTDRDSVDNQLVVK
ncbi:MAG TPA: PRC-barrel domain-containing protein [Verrucomicrobiales bacterium]|nr:PRC-barrel domain-containing protein [Verrucomicrobiales bacterium]